MSSDYCPRCHKRTPHIKDADEMLCKRCGKKDKNTPIKSFTTGGFK